MCVCRAYEAANTHPWPALYLSQSNVAVIGLPSGRIGIGSLQSLGKLQGRSSEKRLQRACSQERGGPAALDLLSARVPLHEALKKVYAALLT